MSAEGVVVHRAGPEAAADVLAVVRDSCGARPPLDPPADAMADTVEAMTSDRPYRKAQPLEAVIDEVQRFSGTQFDPTVASAFLSLIEREEEGFLERASKFDIEGFLTLDDDD